MRWQATHVVHLMFRSVCMAMTSPVEGRDDRRSARFTRTTQKRSLWSARNRVRAGMPRGKKFRAEQIMEKLWGVEVPVAEGNR